MKEFIIILLLTTATSGDKQAVKTKLKSMFNDNVQITVTWLQREKYLPNPTKIYWRLVVSTEQLEKNMKVDLSNVTKAKFDAWKAANMTNPNQLQVATGDDWRATLDAAGFEMIPEPMEPPE